MWDFDPVLLAESGICGLIIQGADETDDTLIVDLSQGDLPLSLTFHGGAGGYDTLVITGVTVGSYTPGQVFGDGTIQAGATFISFTGLEPVFIDGASVSGAGPMGLDTTTLPSTLTFITPLSADAITIDSPAAGQNRISGTSGGVPFESITFTNIQTVLIDTGTNDEADADGDTITIAGDLVATGLKNLAITTGSGDDTLVVQTAHFTLPAPGGAFVFDGGTDLDTVRGPNAAIVWDLSGSGSGHLGGVSGLAFSNVESLVGSGNQDTYVFANAASFGGTIDGGSGQNALDYSAYTTPVTVNLGAGTATARAASATSTT